MKFPHGIVAFLLFVMVVAFWAGARSSSPKSGGYLLVANKGDQTLGIVDPTAGKQIATIPEGGNTGHEVIASPDGRTAYVPIYGDSGVGKPGTNGQNIAVIDLVSKKVTGSIDFGHGVRPHCIQFGPKDGLLYVTTELENAISVIDPHTLKIVRSIPTGQPESHMLAISADGSRAYTANVGPGTVSVLDMKARKTLAVIQVSPQIQRIALSPDGSMAFTSDQATPQLAVIDTASNKIRMWVPLPGLGYGTAPTPDGQWLVVAVRTTNKVAVINLRSMKVEHAIDVPAAPQEVLIAPDGGEAYVSCDASRKVVAIRTSDWAIEKTIDVGPGADGLAWAALK